MKPINLRLKKIKYQGIISNIDINSEKKAIIEFLNKYWNVKIKGDYDLRKVVSKVFDEGIKYGIAYWEDWVEELIKKDNRYVWKTPRKKVKFARTYKKGEYDDTSVESNLEKMLEGHAKISAKPKGYDRYKAKHDQDEYPEYKGDLEFEGTPLFYALAAGCFRFQEALSKERILHHDEPLNSMITSIFLQGKNYGILLVEQKYGPKIEEASAIMDKDHEENPITDKARKAVRSHILNAIKKENRKK